MMKKRKVLPAVTAFLCLMTAACQNTADNRADGGSVDSEIKSEIESRDREGTAGIEEGENSIPEMELDFDYVYETDDQPDISMEKVCTGNGFYTMTQISNAVKGLSGYFLSFYDYGAECTVPVCGKPDCTHDNEDCNAYFPNSLYPMPEIYFNEGSLYILKDSDGYCCMEQISPDGAERKISCKLYRTVVDTSVDDDGMLVTSTSYPAVKLHRGYAYFSTYYPGNKECGLYRIRLGSEDESELLCMQECDYPILFRLKGYGRYMFFQKGNYFDEEGKSLDIDVYAWDTVENKVIKVADDVIRNYTVGENYLYYLDLENRDSVMQYNLLTGERKLILDSGGKEAPLETQMFVRDGKLYYSEPGIQKVFDEEGNLEATLKGGDMISPY